MRSAVSRRGLELVACKGLRMTVVVSARAFHFGALASRWLIQISEGVSGKINGRFRMQDDSSNKLHKRPADPAEPEAPAGR
jgi:hypothetical protein